MAVKQVIGWLGLLAMAGFMVANSLEFRFPSQAGPWIFPLLAGLGMGVPAIVRGIAWALTRRRPMVVPHPGGGNHGNAGWGDAMAMPPAAALTSLAGESIQRRPLVIAVLAGMAIFVLLMRPLGFVNDCGAIGIELGFAVGWLAGSDTDAGPGRLARLQSGTAIETETVAYSQTIRRSLRAGMGTGLLTGAVGWSLGFGLYEIFGHAFSLFLPGGPW